MEMAGRAIGRTTPHTDTEAQRGDWVVLGPQFRRATLGLNARCQRPVPHPPSLLQLNSEAGAAPDGSSITLLTENALMKALPDNSSPAFSSVCDPLAF